MRPTLSASGRSRQRACALAALLAALVIGCARPEVQATYPEPLKMPEGADRYLATLVVWDTGWPIARNDGLGYKDFLDWLTLGFEERWPGVEVRYRLFQPGEVEKELRSAMSSGSALPDVYIGPLTLDLVRGPLVDLTGVAGPEIRSEIPAAIQQAIAADEKLYAVPRWADVSCWAATPAAIGRAGASTIASFRTEGWTWEDFLEFPEKGERWHLALDSRDAEVFEAIAQNALGSGDMAQAILAERRLEPLRDAAGAIRTLRERGKLACSGDKAFKGKLAATWKGDALFVAPANLGLIRHAADRRNVLQIKDPGAVVEEPLFVPVPRLGERHVIPIQLEAASVFARRDDPTGARMALASELALHLARWGSLWPASCLKTVPAWKSLQGEWAAQAGLREENAAFLLESVNSAGNVDPWVRPALSPPDALAHEAVSNAVISAMRRALEGKLEPSGLPSEIEAALQ